MFVESDYLRCVFDRYEFLGKLEEAEDFLRREVPDFQVIACQGVSGLAFASVLAYRMEKGLLVVRKEGKVESSHSCMGIEGCIPTGNDKWLIVDDFVSTGATMARILRMVGWHSRLVGAYLYQGQGPKRFYNKSDLVAMYTSFRTATTKTSKRLNLPLSTRVNLNERLNRKEVEKPGG